MGVPTGADLIQLIKDRTNTDASVDGPLGNEALRILNDTLRQVWNLAGGRIKSVDSATAWDQAHLQTNGTVYGLLTNVQTIEHLYATLTAPFSITGCVTTATSKAITVGASASTVLPGMAVSLASTITAGTLVRSVTSAVAATLTQNALLTTNPATLTFSPTTGSIELEPVEMGRIKHLRQSAGNPTYVAPRLYCAERVDANAVQANVNLLRLEIWPAVTGYYLPMEYVAQWTDVDSTANTTPDLDDVQARIGGLIAASILANTAGRTDQIDAIMDEIMGLTAAEETRKFRSLVDASQDREVAVA